MRMTQNNVLNSWKTFALFLFSFIEGSLAATSKETEIGSTAFWLKLVLVIILVLFGGLVAGLTLGLMSLDATNLHILTMSGDERQKKYASRIQPIRKNGHLLLVTLLISNTLVNETLPILMDDLFHGGLLAVLVSTSLIVIFGEILPQSICSRYGLAIGAFFAWPVQILIWVLWIIAYPISRLLDWMLGQNREVLYRRAELKELVQMHGDVERGGTLSKDEVTIIKGALDLTHKTAATAMTELPYVFTLSCDESLDRSTITNIVRAGHSRIPVYASNNPKNIIGVLLVKSLILVDPEDELFVRDLRINKIPYVPDSINLFDMLNKFQLGNSHMAVVYRKDDQEKLPIGIITLEDVIEELIQEEILDETDVFVDVKTRLRVVRALNPISNTSLSSPLSRPSLPVNESTAANNTTTADANTTNTTNAIKKDMFPPILITAPITNQHETTTNNNIKKAHVFSTPKMTNGQEYLNKKLKIREKSRSLDDISSVKASSVLVKGSDSKKSTQTLTPSSERAILQCSQPDHDHYQDEEEEDVVINKKQ